MSFLDRFKRKTPEPQAAEARRDSAPPKAERAATRTMSGPAPKSNGGGKKDENKAVSGGSFVASPVRASEVHEMALELGDFLHRIPQNFLQPGPHDVHQVLRFKVDHMADLIGRGQTTIQLAEIYRQLPSIFRAEVRESEDGEIRFPWQKVMMLLNQSRGARKGAAFTEAAAIALTEKIKTKRSTRNIVPVKPDLAAPELKLFTPEPAPPEPTPAPAPVVEPAPAQPAKMKQIVAPAIDVSGSVSTTTEDDDRLTREEILRARDQANRSLLRVKGEYERALSTARDERKALAEERDRVIGELDRAKKEVQDKLDQVAFEKSVVSKSNDNIQKLVKERDALLRQQGQKPADAAAAPTVDQKKIDAFQQQIAALEEELATAKRAGEAAVQKREAELTASLAQLQSKLEAAQQHHTKLTAELDSARSAHGGATAQLDASTAALRSEFDAAGQKREAEFAAALAELQSHLKTARDRHSKLSEELDQAYAANGDTIRSTEERIQNETAALRRDLEAAAQKREEEFAGSLRQLQDELHAAREHGAKAGGASTPELEAAAQKLEAELNAARAHHAKLTAEIDEARSGKELATAALRSELEAAAQKREAELTASIQQLQNELHEARTARERASHEIEQATAALRAEFEAAARKREAETEPALTELGQEIEQSKAAAAGSRLEIESANAREAEARMALAQLQQQLHAAQEHHTQLSAELVSAHASKTETVHVLEDRLAQEHAIRLEDSATALRREFEAAAQKRDAEVAQAIEQLNAQLRAAHEARDGVLAELDQVKSATAQLDQDSARKLDETTAALRQEFEAAAQKREAEIAEALQQHHDTRSGIAADLEKAKSDAAAAVSLLKMQGARKLEESAAALTQEFTAVAQKREAELAQSLQQLTDQLNAAREERARLAEESERAKAGAAAAIEQLRGEFDTANQRREAEVAHALTQLHEQLNAAQGHHKLLAADLDQTRAAHEAMVADTEASAASRASWESRAVVQLEADIETYRSRIKEMLLDREAVKNNAEAAVSELRGVSETLSAERDALLKAKAELERRIADSDRSFGEYESRIKDLQNEITSQAAKHEQALDALGKEKDSVIVSVTSERDSSLRAKGQAEKRLAESERVFKETKARAQRLEVDLNTASSKLREKDEHLPTLLAQHQEALTAQTTKHAQTITEFSAEKEAAITAIAAERDAAHKAQAEMAKRHADAESAIAEHLAKIRILEADVLDAQTSVHRKDNEISRLAAEHQDKFISLTQSHERALGTLSAGKDAAISAIAAEHDSTQRAKIDLEQQLAAAREDAGTAHETAGERQTRIQALEAALAEVQSALQRTESEVARINREHRDALTAHGERHERALNALVTEKNAAVSAITAEKAALAKENDDKLAAHARSNQEALASAASDKAKAVSDLRAEMERTIATLTSDRDGIRSAKIAAEGRLGSLIHERDEAKRETQTIADRLAVVSIETDRKIADLEKAVTQLQDARKASVAEFEEAREAHKAQSAVFAREFKGVVKQRDEAQAEIAGIRTSLEEKIARLESERAELVRKEAELSERHDREITRLRRERDLAAGQRDELRARFERILADQREMLDGLNSELRTAPKTKPAPEPEPRKESNVIEMTEAEIVREREPESDSHLKIPRIRPMVIPPPNVRVL